MSSLPQLEPPVAPAEPRRVPGPVAAIAQLPQSAARAAAQTRTDAAARAAMSAASAAQLPASGAPQREELPQTPVIEFAPNVHEFVRKAVEIAESVWHLWEERSNDPKVITRKANPELRQYRTVIFDNGIAYVLCTITRAGDEPIGRGGFKIVKRALGSDGRQYAVFALRHDRMAPVDYANTIREFEFLVSQRGVPGLIQVNGIYETNQKVYVIMERYKKDLFHYLIVDGKRPSPEEQLRIISQMAIGLGALHRQNIIHRDLKPTNVLLKIADDGVTEAVIADLGAICRDIPVAGEAPLARKDYQAGTTEYLPPELLYAMALGKRVSGPSFQALTTKGTDLWALGAMIYEIITGTSFYTVSGSPFHTTRQNVHGCEVINSPFLRICQRYQNYARSPNVTEFIEELNETLPYSQSAFTSLLRKNMASTDPKIQALAQLATELLRYEHYRRPSIEQVIARLVQIERM